jgi:hypothetical protein
MGDKTVQTIAKESLKSDPAMADTRKFAVQHLHRCRNRQPMETE